MSIIITKRNSNCYICTRRTEDIATHVILLIISESKALFHPLCSDVAPPNAAWNLMYCMELCGEIHTSISILGIVLCETLKCYAVHCDVMYSVRTWLGNSQVFCQTMQLTETPYLQNFGSAVTKYYAFYILMWT